jgi:hypothetical protein
MVRRSYIFPIIFLSLFTYGHILAQTSIINKTVTYEEVYNDPYDINRLFFHFQPVYGEFFRTNINIGFGLRADYSLKNKIDFAVQFRMPYGARFDFNRDNAQKNSNFENSPKAFLFMEAGGFYHIIDKETEGKSKFVLYSKSTIKQDQWESSVPEYVEAPVKIRRVYGVRAGGVYYQTSLNINDIANSQNVTIVDSSGTAMPQELKAFSNMTSTAFYLGGGLSIIKNIALKFDKTYDEVSNDLIFNAFFDIFYAPWLNVDDLYYKPAAGLQEIIYSTSPIKTNSFGFRAGIDGKFNRFISFGYGIETGIRPGIKNQGFFILGRISFPVIGTNISGEVEAFGK